MSTRLCLHRYARLVPLHSRDGYNSLGSAGQVDKRQVLVNGKPALEYDGLRNGELAWILGRRFKSIPNDLGSAGTLNTGAPPAGGTGTGIDELTDSQRYAHQAYAGLGNGVDRMQRLASTDWVESLVGSKLGTSKINLHAINVGSDYSKAMDSALATYAPFLAGSTAIHGVDVAFGMADASGNAAVIAAVGPTQKQGILCYEAGPFLRGVQASYDAVEIRDILGTSASQDVARNMGDTLCFSALDAELRRRNLMDWTPDGIVLSKLESPTDEPMKSIEMDSRSAQLFNVGIQGPAITTSWTSDLRDYKLECQPMDKVFVCIVADLSWITDTDAMTNSVSAARQARVVLNRAIRALDVAQRTPGPMNQQTVRNAKALVNTEINNCKNAANAIVAAAVGSTTDPSYDALVAAWLTAKGNLQTAEDSPVRPVPAAVITAYNTAEGNMVARLGGWSTGTDPADKVLLDTQLDEMQAAQDAMRKGDMHVSKATLTNFRLMRTTSSHMANYSQWKPGNVTSRLGLRLGKHANAGGGDVEGAGEYIIGGWCVGTVIDSAASRSTVGTLVRTAPTSMALNVSVNIEWWSGDKLYKHYMDDSGLTLMRGQPSTALFQRKAGVAGSGIAAGTKRSRAAADIDVDQSFFVADLDSDEEITAEQREAAGFEPLGRRAPGSSALPGASTAVPAAGRRAGGAQRR